jgi:hypothetical protein
MLVIGPWSLALSAEGEPIQGFTARDEFSEQTREQQIDDVRILAVASQSFDSHKPTSLIIYALPNGNSIEQTIGCREAQGRDWHFYIQHIGAQTRLLREIDPDENVVIAYVEATAKGVGLSWPAWKQQHADAPQRIRDIVGRVVQQLPGKPSIGLVAHSGGGSFVTSYINTDAIDDRIARIAFLDANYTYHDEQHHGEKLLAWLRGDVSRMLVVLAYDDRNIELNGKKVVPDYGGTWRASFRMIDFFRQQTALQQGTFRDDFDTFTGMNGQIRFFLLRNPNNQILHTRLVGEMSGFVAAMTMGTDHERQLAEPVAYEKWISAEPIALSSAKPQATTRAAQVTLNLPERAADAIAGSAFIQRVASVARDDREQAIVEEVQKGNVPEFVRTLVSIDVKFTGVDGIPHLARYYVTPDYLSIGSDGNFVRMPMCPRAAQEIADLLDCSLPTRKMVNDIDTHAVLRLAPQPMTVERESPWVFLEHNCLIEQQRFGRATGALICGVKKDIVVTNRLKEKSNRVAIYGWRKPDGTPIQPLTIVHSDTYVDYSHGVRLVARKMLVDGRETTVDAVLKDPELCGLLSDEGVIDKPDYR